MKTRAFYLYLGILGWLVLLAVLLIPLHLNQTGLGITLAVLTAVLLPGYFLKRIIQIEVEDFSKKIIYQIGLGLGFYFLINLFALFLNLTIFQLGYLILILLIILFATALYRDRKVLYQFSLISYLKGKSLADYLLFLTILIAATFSFLAIDAQSDKLLGDGYFHLAILRKITSGEGLSPYNLWVTKETALNIVYSFPLWHIFVGLISKILSISIFTAFKQILLPLVIFSFFAWYGFAKTLFQNKYIAGVCFLSFLLIMLKDSSFYFLVVLASPDSFNRLFLLPMIFIFTIDYLFSDSKKISQNLPIIILLAIFMGLIHFPQFIYLMVILLISLILIIIFDRKSQAFLKLTYLLSLITLLILPYLLIVQREMVFDWIRANMIIFQGDIYKYQAPAQVNIIYRYAVLALPILVLFFKKNRRIIFLFSISLSLILISWQIFGLRVLFLKYFGQIFVERAIANLPAFISFGFLLSLIIFYVNYLITKLPKKIILIIDIFIGLTTALVIVQSGTRLAVSEFLERTIFNSDSILFSQMFWWVFLLVSLGTVAYFIVRGHVEINLSTMLEIKEPSNKLNLAVLIFAIILLLSTPYISGLNKVFAENSNGTILTNRSSNIVSDIRIIGGQKMIDFLNSVPKRSVFITDNPSISQLILLYSDNLAAEYPYSVSQFSESASFYNELLSDEERIAVLGKLQVDYILIRHPEDDQFVLARPEFFKEVLIDDFDYPIIQEGSTKLVPVEYKFYQFIPSLKIF